MVLSYLSYVIKINQPNKLDLEEQTKIKRLGIEMQLLTSEIEEKADRWNEPQNEIVKVKIIEIVGFKYLFYKVRRITNS